MNATRFMRKPFICKGFLVTEDNMDIIARWCKGHVVRDVARPFVRVPVIRSTNERQTRAYAGTWVVVSVFEGTEKSYKVYKTEWLEKSFFELTDWDGDTDDDELPAEDLATCCAHNHSNVVSSLPTQQGKPHRIPSPATIFRPAHTS